MALVDPDMRFVAEHWRGDLGKKPAIRPLLPAPALQRPARVTVLLRQSGRLGDPSLGDTSVLDDGAFLVGHALAWSRNDAGVDDLSAHGEIAQALEVAIEPSEQGVDSISADQGFAKAPDRRLVGRVVAIVEPQETNDQNCAGPVSGTRSARPTGRRAFAGSAS